MDRKRRIARGLGAALILVGILGMVGCNLIPGKEAKNAEKNPSVSDQSRDINAWGEVQYGRVYDISIDFPSSVTNVNVKEGDAVSKGDVLVTLDMTEYQGNINKLQQQLTAIRAEIAQTQADSTVKAEEYNNGSKAELKLLQNSLARAKKEVENARRDVQNYQAQYETGAVSKDILNQFTEVLEQKEKVQADIENNIEKTKRMLQEELDQLNLALKTKQAQAEQVKIDLDLLKNKIAKEYFNGNQLVSCVEKGIIQSIDVVNATKLGIQNAPTRVLRLVDRDSLVIKAEVQEEFIEKIALGGTVKVVPASNKNSSLSGVVTQISNVAVEKDGRRIVKVEVKVQDEAGVLKPGYSVDVYFPL